MFCNYNSNAISEVVTPSMSDIVKMIIKMQKIDKNMINFGYPLLLILLHGCSLNYTAIGVHADEGVSPCAASQDIIYRPEKDGIIDYNKIVEDAERKIAEAQQDIKKIKNAKTIREMKIGS